MFGQADTVFTNIIYIKLFTFTSRKNSKKMTTYALKARVPWAQTEAHPTGIISDGVESC